MVHRIEYGDVYVREVGVPFDFDSSPVCDRREGEPW